MKTYPNFRVDKSGSKPRVFVCCSQCEKDIREMHPGERIDVRRAYYCDDCDPGVVVLNTPEDRTDD